VDGNILTSRGPATALLFALKLAEKLVGKQVAENVSKKTMANILRW
ncbi:MAG: DJ-1 family protein, partial [Candidatus Bathyarchaeota archaeon]|nr:DJ-1 family protein [Candidatus Bathyarchaeota archaeon]